MILKGGVETWGDEEKLFFYLLRENVIKYVKARSRYLIWALIFFFVLTSHFLFINNYEFDHFKATFSALFGLGGISLFLSSLLMIINLVNLLRLEKPKPVFRMANISLPIDVIPFQEKSLYVDRSGLFDSVKFQFPYIPVNNHKQTQDGFKKIQRLSKNFPLILSYKSPQRFEKQYSMILKNPNVPIFGEEQTFKDLIFQMGVAWSNQVYNSVSLPVLCKNSPVIQYLKSDAYKEHQHNKQSAIQVANAGYQDIENQIHIISGIVDEEKSTRTDSDNIDALVDQMLSFLDYASPRFDYVVQDSLRNVAGNDFQQTFQILEHASYNYYCPFCNEVMIELSLIHI